MAELSLAIEDLKTVGYTAVRVIGDNSELEQLRSSFWDFFEALGTGIDRKDPTTWEDDRWPLQDRGILHNYNVGWTRVNWELRQHPNVQLAFKKVWAGLLGLNTLPNLLSSMDGLCLIRPPELVESEAERIRSGSFRSWPHVDQSPLKRGLDTIQGLVTLYESGPDDGGLVVYKGTLADYPKFWLLTRIRLAMAVPGINEDIVRAYQRIKLNGPAGTLFLWDSRVVHCNEAPKIGRSLPSAPPEGSTPDLRYTPRAVCYVCMSPSSLATAKQQAKLADAGRNGRSFGHNVYNLGLFPSWKPGVGPKAASMDPVDPTKVNEAKGWATEMTNDMKRLLAILPYPDDRSAPGTPLPRDSEERDRRDYPRVVQEAVAEAQNAGQTAASNGPSSPSRL